MKALPLIYLIYYTLSTSFCEGQSALWQTGTNKTHIYLYEPAFGDELKLMKHIDHIFDINGNLIEKKEFPNEQDSEGTTIEKYLYEYTQKGKIKKFSMAGGGISTEFIYDSHDSLIETQTYRSKFLGRELLQSRKFIRNTSGNTISSEVYENKTLIQKTKYQYTSDGKVKLFKTYDVNGPITSGRGGLTVPQMEFSYNDSRNLLSATLTRLDEETGKSDTIEVTMHTYTQEGLFRTEKINYQKNQKILLFYNKSGQADSLNASRLKELVFKEGPFEETTTYTYDERNHLVEEKSYVRREKTSLRHLVSVAKYKYD